MGVSSLDDYMGGIYLYDVIMKIITAKSFFLRFDLLRSIFIPKLELQLTRKAYMLCPMAPKNQKIDDVIMGVMHSNSLFEVLTFSKNVDWK